MGIFRKKKSMKVDKPAADPLDAGKKGMQHPLLHRNYDDADLENQNNGDAVPETLPVTVSADKEPLQPGVSFEIEEPAKSENEASDPNEPPLTSTGRVGLITVIWYVKKFMVDYFAICLFMWFVAVDTAKTISNEFHGNDANSLTTNVGVCVGSCIASLLISAVYYGPKSKEGGLARCFSLVDIAECAPISFVFACGNALNLMQYRFGVPASVGKVIAQLKVPISAWVSKFILNKKHAFNQWIAIYLQLLSVSVFLIVRSGGDTAVDTSELMIFIGMMFGVTNTLFAVTGAVMNEKVFKKSFKTPFIVQKFHVEVSQLAFAVSFLWLFPLTGRGIDYFL